ncbi:SRPBCC family protein [Auraticoccus sp. F435]|uniref:SRPBCC family protein n=1 Tax=Auraticoccus cholistanensis TaxID=2656650 RepID=A0A6A9V0Z1_9ACTN|nr:SRPBCC family protein [Auraticoccus cholistanensis]MVA76190.1 SRPBCC family protein [Auraticoccus cholistanensis]
MYRLSAEVLSPARPEQIWEVLLDWSGQHRWIPMTSVEVVEGTGREVGDRVLAVSRPGPGRRRLGLVDRMRVSRIIPGHLLEVEHLGPQFRGRGEFRLVDEGSAGTRITCTEDVTGPALVVRAVPLAGPVARRALRRSLRALSEVALRHCAAHPPGEDPKPS